MATKTNVSTSENLEYIAPSFFVMTSLIIKMLNSLWQAEPKLTYPMESKVTPNTQCVGEICKLPLPSPNTQCVGDILRLPFVSNATIDFEGQLKISDAYF